MSYLNKFANFALDWLPFLKGRIPSTEYVPESNELEDDFEIWIEIPINNYTIGRTAALVHNNIKSIEFKFSEKETKPTIIYPFRELIAENIVNKIKNGSKLILLKCSMHPVKMPEKSSMKISCNINSKKFEVEINSSLNPIELYNLDPNLEKDILSACWKEPILETINPDSSYRAQPVRTVEDSKYLADHGNVMIHKDTFICRFLHRNRNYEWDHKSLIKMYKVRDKPDYVCFKKSDLSHIKSGVKKEIFDKIIYINTESMTVQITEITTKTKEGRIKIMISCIFAQPVSKIYSNQVFKKIKV